MEEIQKIFDYQGAEVRTVIDNDELWFVAKDVCDILELNSSEAVRGRKDRNFEDGLDDIEFRDGIDSTDTIEGVR
jgi:anti-repressor protein